MGALEERGDKGWGVRAKLLEGYSTHDKKDHLLTSDHGLKGPISWAARGSTIWSRFDLKGMKERLLNMGDGLLGLTPKRFWE